MLQLNITPEGHTADISVRRSSANTDLDDASTACASNWQYRPAMQDGVPVKVPWTARIDWKIGVSEPFMAIDSASYQCVTVDPATKDQLRQAPLHAVVRVHIKDERITDVTLVASSGDPDLDRKVESCYKNLSPELAAGISGDVDELFVAMLPPENLPH